MPGELTDDDDKKLLKAENDQYEKFYKEKVGSDMYSNNFSQSLNPPKKVKVLFNQYNRKLIVKKKKSSMKWKY